MAFTPNLPPLHSDGPFANLSDYGVWSQAADLRALANAMKVGADVVNADDIKSIPDAWAQAHVFQEALLDPTHEMHLAVRGQEIVDPSGQPILLRGWNWGHWGKAQASDATDNAAQGANVVRIPLRWWGFYEGRGIDSRDDNASATAGISPAHLKHLDEMVQWASGAKLWIVLFIDSDCGQNGTQDADEKRYCDPKGEFPQGHNFWTDKAMRQKFLAVWRFIANLDATDGVRGARIAPWFDAYYRLPA